jgi:hypothetical protein
MEAVFSAAKKADAGKADQLSEEEQKLLETILKSNTNRDRSDRTVATKNSPKPGRKAPKKLEIRKQTTQRTGG